MTLTLIIKGLPHKGRKFLVESPDAYMLANILSDAMTGHGIKHEVVKPGPRGPRKKKKEEETLEPAG